MCSPGLKKKNRGLIVNTHTEKSSSKTKKQIPNITVFLKLFQICPRISDDIPIPRYLLWKQPPSERSRLLSPERSTTRVKIRKQKKLKKKKNMSSRAWVEERRVISRTRAAKNPRKLTTQLSSFSSWKFLVL
ncbi:hypothetical protein CEXT_231111 [Caerostris extrusa]|uniref:Uncharacterized protein n=1 Tax=Caerostris extrusa TaxID=172846 RepID=A0AAV4R3Y3_CAEEX|nr:hypothetical protein CEXT_231111 [Caerostris extrusa]